MRLIISWQIEKNGGSLIALSGGTPWLEKGAEPPTYSIIGWDGRELGLLHGFPHGEMFRFNPLRTMVALERSSGESPGRDQQIIVSDGIRHLVVEQGESRGSSGTIDFDWSPDGTQLAYSWLNEVRVIEISTGARLGRVQGSDPSWCPGGGEIVYRNPDGRLTTWVRKSGDVLVFPGLSEVSGGVKWSPCGRYFLTLEDSAERINLTNGTRDLTVVRVADGDKVQLKNRVYVAYMGVRDFGWADISIGGRPGDKKPC
jgi:WD40 repeat protein